RRAIEVHRTGAALRDAAAELGTGEPDDVPQHPQQRHVGLADDGMALPVDEESDGRHEGLPARNPSGGTLCQRVPAMMALASGSVNTPVPTGTGPVSTGPVPDDRCRKVDRLDWLLARQPSHSRPDAAAADLSTTRETSSVMSRPANPRRAR